MNVETIGWDNCDHCGGSVAVKKNRGGMAYYRCDHCGFLGQHFWARTSEKLIAKVSPKSEEKLEKPTTPQAHHEATKAAKSSFSTLLMGG